jgi:hypothetical protein
MISCVLIPSSPELLTDPEGLAGPPNVRRLRYRSTVSAAQLQHCSTKPVFPLPLWKA